MQGFSDFIPIFVSVCFVPNSLNATYCAAFIWAKSPMKWNAQLPESKFQTRSRRFFVPCR
ncbi:DUF6783 domain-containing protein [Lachnospiraceae bacterium 45-P1]